MEKKGGNKTNRRSILTGAAILTLSAVAVKFLGFFYKIPLLSLLKGEGMGYYHSAFELYALLSVIAAAGIPPALSVLISGALAKEGETEANGIYATAMRLFLCVGGAGSILMYLSAPFYCRAIGNPEALSAVRAISPSLFFLCITATVRGYFQGRGEMLPTALSELTEAGGKLVFGLLFAKTAIARGAGAPEAAAGAGLGLSVGSAIAALFLLIGKRMKKSARGALSRHIPGENRKNLFRVLTLSLPMTVSAALGGAARIVETGIILRGLQALGMSAGSANEIFGEYATMALSVWGILPALIGSLIMPLIPALSAAIAEGNESEENRQIELAFSTLGFFAIPAAIGITLFASPILQLLFPREATVKTVAPLLSLLGVSAFSSGLVSVTNAVLQARKQVGIPIASMLAGSIVKLAVTAVLIQKPEVAMKSLPMGVFAGTAVTSGINIVFLFRKRPNPGVLAYSARQTVVSAAALGAGYALWMRYENCGRSGNAAFLVTLFSAAVLYFVLSLAIHSIPILPDRGKNHLNYKENGRKTSVLHEINA